MNKLIKVHRNELAPTGLCNPWSSFPCFKCDQSSLWTSDPFDHGIVINMVGKGTNEYFELDHI